MMRLRDTKNSTRRRPGRMVARVLACIGILALGSSAALSSPVKNDPSEKDRDLRSRGWTVDSITLEGADEPGTRRLVASGRITIPAKDVWTIVARPDDDRDPWPSLKEVVVEHVAGDTTVSRFVMSVPVYKDRRYRLRSITDARAMRLHFELVPGYGNVRQIHGFWKISRLDDSLTHMTYQVDTDPGVKLVPSFIVNWATRKAVPRLFEYIMKESLRLRGLASIPVDRMP